MVAFSYSKLVTLGVAYLAATAVAAPLGTSNADLDIVTEVW